MDCSLVKQNLIVAEEIQKKENGSRKKGTYVEEQEEEGREGEGGRDEETGGRAGRSSGRGRTLLVGGRERSRRNFEEEREAALGRSIGVRGRSCRCCWITSGLRAGKSAMSSFGRAIPVAVAASRGN